MNPTLPYESWRDALLAACCSSSGRFRAWRLPNRCAWDDLRRPSVGDDGEDSIDASDVRRLASLGASGMAGTVLSVKTLLL